MTIYAGDFLLGIYTHCIVYNLYVSKYEKYQISSMVCTRMLKYKYFFYRTWATLVQRSVTRPSLSIKRAVGTEDSNTKQALIGMQIKSVNKR